eukprot:NODE_707_length_1966_cov_29.159103_g654_i0.p1 GENE.NODE_707_length_1966_cov_29.159103_g654_i0~~NODE_707_length_1966_cov_29.159103_g654_i0.p1  ORF type:complete len:557 (+),score=109.36 NODE_707_length_1966_cov_29.159103_g654_i0:164-1834(+)
MKAATASGSGLEAVDELLSSHSRYRKSDANLELAGYRESLGERISFARNMGMPITHSIPLRGHTKSVSAFAIDRSGTWMVTGAWDFHIRFWNFAGMTSTFKFYREIDPTGEFHGAYTFNQIAFNHNGEMFVLAKAHPQPLLFSREGKELFEFCKGDLYVTEMSATKGHTAEVTGLQWSPGDKETIMTCGKDSTVRLWNLEKLHKINAQVIKTAQGVARNRRSPVTCATYTPTGMEIIAGTMDGNVYCWPSNGPYIKPLVLRGCHPENTTITSLGVCRDERTFATRAGDDTMKIWDLRRGVEPLAVFRDLETKYDQIDVAVSPDDKYFVTGTSVRKGQGQGQLIVVERATLQIVARVGMDASVTRVQWHNELNQLIVGTSEGVLHVMYDPLLSKKGAMLCATKHKAFDPSDMQTPGQFDIRTPNNVPMFQEDTWKAMHRKSKMIMMPDRSGVPPKNKRAERADQRPSEKHALLIQGGLTRTTIRDEDPVEKLRAVAAEAEAQPLYINTAYTKNPQKIFATSSYDDDDPEHPVFGDRSGKRQKILQDLRESGRNMKTT